MKGDKKTNRKGNKTLRQKKGANKKKKINKRAIKEKKLKIKILVHELLDSTLFYLMLPP
jgi:hypothetical protein